jgi:hypothetical protein
MGGRQGWTSNTITFCIGFYGDFTPVDEVSCERQKALSRAQEKAASTSLLKKCRESLISRTEIEGCEEFYYMVPLFGL